MSTIYGRRHPTGLVRAGGRTRGAFLLFGIGFALAGAALAGCDSDTTVPPDPLTIAPGPQLTLEVGEQIQLTARGGTGLTAWSSSNPQVAAVVEVTGFVEAVGPGSAEITVLRSSQTASVSVQVTEPPVMALTPPSLSFAATVGDGPTQPQGAQVTNAGGGSLGSISVTGVSYGAGELQGWVLYEVVAGEVRFRADPGSLPEGVYTATAAIAASEALNSPQTVALTLELTGLPEISLDPPSVSFTAEAGTAGPPRQTVQVQNVGSGELGGLSASVSYGAGSADGWLGAPSLSPTAGGHVLFLDPATATLPRGSYEATVTVRSSRAGVEERTLPVSLRIVDGPAIGVNPTSISFEMVQGQSSPGPRTLQILNAGGGTLSGLSVSISYPSPPLGWLSGSLGGTVAPANIQLSVNPSGIPAGTHTARIRITAPGAENSPVDVPVTFSVTAPGVVSLNPSIVNLGAVLGGSNPSAVAIQVTNSGGGNLAVLSAGNPVYVAGPATGWLSVSQPGTSAPTQFTIQASTGSLPAGNYRALVTVSSTSPGSSSQTLQVNLEVYPLFTQHVFPNISGGPCGNCHFAGGQPPQLTGTASQVYFRLLNGGHVVPGNANLNQGFLCRVTPGRCTTHSNKFSSANAELARLWVMMGARF